MASLPFDWSFLFGTDNATLRAEITEEDYAQEAMTFIQSVDAFLHRELMRIATDAQRQADVFWEQNRRMRETGDKTEQGRYGTRVRVEKASLTAEWYKNVFRSTGQVSKKPPLLDISAKDEQAIDSLKVLLKGYVIPGKKTSFLKLRIAMKKSDCRRRCFQKCETC
jgi:hypothetical protein